MPVVLLAVIVFAVAMLLRTVLSRPPVQRAEPPPSDGSTVVIRRIYTWPDGLKQPGAATEPETKDSISERVTFAGDKAPAARNTIPEWDDIHPLQALGPEREDGTPDEFLAEPPEPSPESLPDDPDFRIEGTDEEPPLGDITDEERQAIDKFDVRAFR